MSARATLDGPVPADPPAAGPPAAPPLTLGTAGHIDHGKTALIRALTGVDCDRLPEERARGITIELGFAPLPLPDGRTLSVIDVPGHERLVRTMVAGATGIDLFLLVVAADDGVMPQTREHVRVLHALGIARGVVAVTRSDLADPGTALQQAATLLPGVPAVACSARTGEGVEAVRRALAAVAREAPSRASTPGPAALHVDRVFSIRGAGTVVTGTLWRGTIAAGGRLRLLPRDRVFRVRGVQVHDRAIAEAVAGQRVAVNLAGAGRHEVRRGDVLVGEGAAVAVTYRVDFELTHGEPPLDRERLQVHHGTRDVPARARALGSGRWQLRLEQPLLAADGDRLVLRRISPPDTLGGGVILDARAGGRRRMTAAEGDSARPVRDSVRTGGERARPAGGTTRPAASGSGAPNVPGEPLPPQALALEERLRAAGHEPPTEAELGEDASLLPALRAAGRAVRIGRSMYAHPSAIESVIDVARRIAESGEPLTLARLRDELHTSRRYAQALLEHLDAARVTRRLPDDRRVLRPPRR